MFVLLRQLQTGKLDLVVGGVLDQVPPDLVQQPLYVDPIVVVCAASHPLANTQRPTWAALVEHPWVLPPREAGARKAIEALLRRYSGSGPTVLAETVSPDMTIELLAQAPALGVLPQRLAQRYADAGRAAVIDIQLTGLTLAMAVFSLAGTKPSAAIEAFVQSLIDTAGQR